MGYTTYTPYIDPADHTAVYPSDSVEHPINSARITKRDNVISKNDKTGKRVVYNGWDYRIEYTNKSGQRVYKSRRTRADALYVYRCV